MKHLVIILSLGMLVACGNKKNPTQGIETTAVPPHSQMNKNQFVEVCPKIKAGSLRVREGQSAVKIIEVIGTDLKNDDQLLVSGGPKELKINPSKISPGRLFFEVSFTATNGMLEIGKNSDEIKTSLTLLSKTKPLTDTQVADCSEPMDIIIVRSDAVPVITKLTGVPKEIDVNSTGLFTVNAEVTVSGLTSEDDLVLSPVPDRTASVAEHVVHNLTPAIVDQSQPKKVKENVYSITLTIDPQIIKYRLKNETPGKKNLLAQLRAQNLRTQFISPTKNLNVVAVIPAPPVKSKEKK